ncbi:MAG TPA: RIP metalloprotease RseP [Methylophilaceae bacterium]|nr:RIP metalloprotease RseP [Methylophilaceae bacterium]
MDVGALMTTLLAFIVTLGVLITVHEYGHFQVARWFGIKVLRFSIGFGKPLYRRKFGKDQTEFILAAFPLGGYVKMLDEREATPEVAILEEDLPRAFNRQSVWKRIAVVAAGPAANLLLAIFIYWLLFMQGVTGLKPVIGDITPGTSAAQASMKSGGLIQTVADEPVATWQDVRWMLLQASADAPSVGIKVLYGDREYHVHQLTIPSSNDVEQDILQKLGLNPLRPGVPAVVGEVIEGSAAAKAQLMPGDKVLAVDGTPVSQWEELVDIVRKSPGKDLTLTIKRGDAESSLTITPEAVRENGTQIGRIGAAYHMNEADMQQFLVHTVYGPVEALNRAAVKTWETSIFSLKMLGNMIVGAVSWKGLSGPVTIASFAGQSADAGWKTFLGFLALVSISLGILNLLPIPVLDGGHLLYYMVEIVKGSPVSERVMEAGYRIGSVLLGILMACALYNDITRLITG